MAYNFDNIIPREQTNCYKYDLRKSVFGTEDVIPLWVADMDFKIADEITQDLQSAISHGIYGYTYHYPELYQSLISWNKARNNYSITPQDILFFHGVVPSINLIIQEFIQEGDEIIIQPPVYHPFAQSIERNKRVVLNNHLVYKNGTYTIDFDDFERQITKKTKLFILCHPHNPVGRNWTLQELQTLDEICQRHNIIVISDEIHSDILLGNARHTPWATISNNAAQNSITLMAPSKTFNIAGLCMSAIITENKEYLQILKHKIELLQLHGISLLSLKAFEAAYSKGEQWLQQLLPYLENNLNTIREFTQANPKITLVEPQATYLAWLDCSALALTPEELNAFFIHKAKVGLSKGIQFGEGGENFMRLNYACPQETLQKALRNIEQALKKI